MLINMNSITHSFNHSINIYLKLITICQAVPKPLDPELTSREGCRGWTGGWRIGWACHCQPSHLTTYVWEGWHSVKQDLFSMSHGGLKRTQLGKLTFVWSLEIPDPTRLGFCAPNLDLQLQNHQMHAASSQTLPSFRG